MKVLVIPDIHGTSHWKKAKDKIDDYDKIIFLGDEFDTWTNIWPEQIENANEIIQFKKDNLEKVELLWSNHAISYYLDEQCSGYQSIHAIDIKEFYNTNKDFFNAIYICNNWIFSHGGVSRNWMKCCGIKDVYEINSLFKTRPNFFRFVGPNGYGNNSNEGPLWIRPEALINNRVANFSQCVGHTEMRDNDKKVIKKDGNIFMFIDSSTHENIIEIIIKEK